MSPLHSYVVVWILLIFAWAANFVIRIGFSALLPPIISELQLSYTRAHDRLVKRGYGSKTAIVAGLTGLAVSMLAMAAAITQRSIPGLAVVLFLAAFFCWSIWGAVYALLARLVREDELGTAFGFSNSISFVGAVVAPTATGWARDLTGSFSAGCVLAAMLAGAGVLLTFAVRVPPRAAA